jgi:hypothetical protein
MYAKIYGNWIPATGRGSSEFAVTKNVTQHSTTLPSLYEKLFILITGS